MKFMRMLVGAIAVVVLAIGLAACGDNDDSTTGAPSATDPEPSPPKSQPSDTGKANESKANAQSKESPRETPRSEEKEAAKFVPKQHKDSGGGSKQFRVPEGYDNSIQEFGAEGGESDREAAATVLHNFYDARAEGNWAATCLYMSANLVESFTKLSADRDVGCAEAVETLTGPLLDSEVKKEADAIDVGALRSEGDRAFLIYRGEEDAVYAISMVKEDGSWKVASYAGTPIG